MAGGGGRVLPNNLAMEEIPPSICKEKDFLLLFSCAKNWGILKEQFLVGGAPDQLLPVLHEVIPGQAETPIHFNFIHLVYLGHMNICLS